MSPLGEFWIKFAADLGVEVVAPFRLRLPDGQEAVADVLVKNFGFRNGMFVVSDFAKIRAVANTIVDLGYGVSTLSGSPDIGHCDIALYHEILADWTWCGPADERPEWLRKWPER